MRTSRFNIYTITYPNEICFAKGHNYLSIASTVPVVESTFTLTIGTSTKDYITLLRSFRRLSPDGSVVFPLDAILEVYAGRNVTMRLAIGDDDEMLQTTLAVLNGASEREVLSMGSSIDPEGVPFPQPALFPIYPTLDYQFQLFMGFLDPRNEMEFMLRPQWMPENMPLDHISGNPFLWVPTFEIDFSRAPEKSTLELYLFIDQKLIALIDYPVLIDPCSDGLFVRWVDTRGMYCIYRWTVETSTEETGIEKDYIRLDGNLRPYRQPIKSSRTRRVLHSRKIATELYTYCASILTGRNVEYLDKTGIWRRCIIDEGECENAGRPLQDLVVELVEDNLILS